MYKLIIYTNKIKNKFRYEVNKYKVWYYKGALESQRINYRRNIDIWLKKINIHKLKRIMHICCSACEKTYIKIYMRHQHNEIGKFISWVAGVRSSVVGVIQPNKV